MLDFAIQITHGLEAAHEKGIVHRDIKPANLFISDKGVVKILDFGLVKLTEAAEKEDCTGEVVARSSLPAPAPDGKALGLSRPGVVLGTAAYMSPEQVRGEKLDARTDLFSFGLVLYEMATGRQAFTGGTAQALHDGILKGEPKSVLQLRSDLPPRLEAIVTRCLQKNRELRYQHAAKIRPDLEKVKREAENPLRRRWPRLAAAAIVVAALVAGGLYWRFRKVPALAAKDTVVVADFANSTGDKLWDDTLKTALAMQLEQSHFLNVLSDEKVSATLRLMNRPNAPLTRR